MSANALLLSGSSGPSAAHQLEGVLAVFGVECSRTTVEELISLRGDSQVRVLCSAASFLELLASFETSAEAISSWRSSVHSAFVSAADDPIAFEKVARQVASDPAASLVTTQGGGQWSVSDELPGFCRSMSGIRVTSTGGPERALVFDGSKSNAASIVFNARGTAFVRVEFHGVPVYMSAGGIVDVQAPLRTRVFDVRLDFLTAVPVVLYVTWAFGDRCWRPAETLACLVVDDPPLRPRYGHINFEHFLRLMERLDFSTSVAFIPWNWNRSARKTVRLFAENHNRFSLSVHGCDHARGEYGDRDRDRLLSKSGRALERMDRHKARTGLPYDRVMVLPQGVFSEPAIEALKRAGFLAVVNTEVISATGEVSRIRVCDYWDVALMSYSEFPIFTRRRPSDGIENFAFDILLGKPCLVVVHHTDFHDDCRQVEGFIAQLKKLNAQLRWMNLAEVVRRSIRQRLVSPHDMEVEIYCSEARIENLSGQQRAFRICKRESTSDGIREIRVGAHAVEWTASRGRVCFEAELNRGESTEVAIAFQELAVDGVVGQRLRDRVRVAARRYLCEARDNYLMPRSIW